MIANQKQESIDEAIIRVQRTFCISSKGKKAVAGLPTPPEPEQEALLIESRKLPTKKTKEIETVNMPEPEKLPTQSPTKGKGEKLTITKPVIEPKIKEVAEPEDDKEMPNLRQHTKATLDRQKKIKEEIEKNPEKYGVSRERIRLVKRLSEVLEDTDKYPSKTEQKKAVDRIVGKLIGKSGQMKEGESTEEEEG